ncbi:type VI secretion system contractile sheath domain-containing protein [Escherichia coli]
MTLPAVGVTALIASILQSTASAEPVNKLVVDSMIADIDERISRQMDVIIHAPAFQQVESFWRSLKTMVDRVDFREKHQGQRASCHQAGTSGRL